MQSSINSNSVTANNNYYSLIINKQQQQNTKKLANQNSSSSSSSPIPPPIPPRSSTIGATSSSFRGIDSIVHQTSDRSGSVTSVVPNTGCATTLLSYLSLSNLGTNKHTTNAESQMSSRESFHSVGNSRSEVYNLLNPPINKKNNDSFSRPGFYLKNLILALI